MPLQEVEFDDFVDFAEEERRQAREPYQGADREADVIWFSFAGQAPAYTPPPVYRDPPPYVDDDRLPDYIDDSD